MSRFITVEWYFEAGQEDAACSTRALSGVQHSCISSGAKAERFKWINHFDSLCVSVTAGLRLKYIASVLTGVQRLSVVMNTEMKIRIP
jgi:hypothetical protein